MLQCRTVQKGVTVTSLSSSGYPRITNVYDDLLYNLFLRCLKLNNEVFLEKRFINLR